MKNIEEKLNPNHYKQGEIEVIDFIISKGIKEFWDKFHENSSSKKQFMNQNMIKLRN